MRGRGGFTEELETCSPPWSLSSSWKDRINTLDNRSHHMLFQINMAEEFQGHKAELGVNCCVRKDHAEGSRPGQVKCRACIQVGIIFKVFFLYDSLCVTYKEGRVYIYNIPKCRMLKTFH